MGIIDGDDCRLFDHTADLGLEVYGDDPAALFGNAARALFELIVSWEDEAPAARHTHLIEVSGADWPDLMVNWLRELLYLWSGREQILVELQIEMIAPTRIRARLTTGDFDPDRHKAGQEIKAVTYHQIEAGPSGDRWRARVIFDI